MSFQIDMMLCDTPAQAANHVIREWLTGGGATSRQDIMESLSKPNETLIAELKSDWESPIAENDFREPDWDEEYAGALDRARANPDEFFGWEAVEGYRIR